MTDGSGRIAIVHRSGHADWSLPKGKVEVGETPADAALREVEEETGMTPEILGNAGTVRYRDHHGQPKRVRYFAMRRLRGSFTPNSEVDLVRWMVPSDAAAALTYSSDREIVAVWAREHHGLGVSAPDSSRPTRADPI